MRHRHLFILSLVVLAISFLSIGSVASRAQEKAKPPAKETYSINLKTPKVPVVISASYTPDRFILNGTTVLDVQAPNLDFRVTTVTELTHVNQLKLELRKQARYFAIAYNSEKRLQVSLKEIL